MRAIIQRVTSSSVEIDGVEINSIAQGLLVFLGIEDSDGLEDVDWLCSKIARLRIFSDENGLMNLSVEDVKGGILVISQFTLHASTKKGNRPSFIRAAKPGPAEKLYEVFLERMQRACQSPVRSGSFGADMKVRLLNDGPVTIFMDTKIKE